MAPSHGVGGGKRLSCTHVQSGGAPSVQAVAVLERLERQKPNNALALFYLGAASLGSGEKPAVVKRWQTPLVLLSPQTPIRAMLEQKVKKVDSQWQVRSIKIQTIVAHGDVS